jgi:hypothetical protein
LEHGVTGAFQIGVRLAGNIPVRQVLHQTKSQRSAQVLGMVIIRMRPKPRLDSASADFAQPVQFGEEGVCRAALAISASRSARCRAYSRNSTIGR